MSRLCDLFRFRRGAGTKPGILIVDKPSGMTSHDVVRRVRKLAKTRRVGHAGTLDPMATGVLVIGIGNATRMLGFIGGSDKDYEGTIRLGVSTVSDDADGDVTGRTDASEVTMEAVEEAIAALSGEILQVPSKVSAIKIAGRRAYSRLRTGEDVTLKARPVTVSAFSVLSIERGDDWLDLDVFVSVSSGTYIRALARDLGAALGVGGHLTALKRTRTGRFEIRKAKTLEGLTKRVEAGKPLPVLTLAEAARQVFPYRKVTAKDRDHLVHGRMVPRAKGDGNPTEEHPLALIGPRGAVVALAVAVEGGSLRPTVVLTDTTTAAQ
jgi:tRNA pseudouridine55 synthase